MASIKVKFRKSTLADKEGIIYYQVIHNQIIRQIKTDYRLFPNEWQANSAAIIVSEKRGTARRDYLIEIGIKIKYDKNRLERIVSMLTEKGLPYNVDDIISTYTKQGKSFTMFSFMQNIIDRMKSLGKTRTSETYTATLHSFKRFRKDEDLLLDKMDSDLIIEYEAYLKGTGVVQNTITFYMRILRAVHNRAIEKGLVGQTYPFRHIRIGIKKTTKRAIDIKYIRKIKTLELSVNTSLDFARDMFLFSFYTRGMSFIDMAYLKKSDLKNGVLSYRRRKTGQLLNIKWEKCMDEVVHKYPKNDSKYLLPIIKSATVHEHTQYKNAQHLVNHKLKEIAKMIGLKENLSMYVARHAWASIAKSKNIPLAIISECMGHDSETTTQIYLASFNDTVIDHANNLILKDL